MTRCTMVGLKGRPSPLGRPRRRRMLAISAQVWWSSSLSISVMVLALVCRIFQAGSGTGRVRVRAWPPARRTCAVMVSLVRVTVTSVSSSRAMRLRSRIGVAGSCQMPGRSVTSWLIRSFRAGVRVPSCCSRALSQAAWASLRAQRGVPAGFEGVGDEPAGGAGGEVAAAGRVGVVAGAFDVGCAQRVGFGGCLPELGGDLEGGLDGQRGERVDEQLAGVLVEGVAGDRGADRAGVVDAVALAEVGGQVFPAAGVVADGHPPAAAAADDDALQQGGSFAGRPGGAVAAVRGGVGREPRV